MFMRREVDKRFRKQEPPGWLLECSRRPDVTFMPVGHMQSSASRLIPPESYQKLGSKSMGHIKIQCVIESHGLQGIAHERGCQG